LLRLVRLLDWFVCLLRLTRSFVNIDITPKKIARSVWKKKSAISAI
jgi:hypothetical protein